MSSVENCTLEGDLIDLHVGSPVLPRFPNKPSDQLPIEEISDNLLDSELPVLEQKLQIASNNQNIVDNTKRNSVDVEDILITIDDDDDDDDDDNDDNCDKSNLYGRLNSIRRSNSEALLNSSCSFKSNLEKSWSCDNLEALNVLKNLDEILNACLVESDKILNINDDDDGETTENSIEACLLELDNYLQNFDSSNCSESHDEDYEKSETEADLQSRLQRIEHNYNKFLEIGCINQGYISTEDNEFIRRGSLVNIEKLLSNGDSDLIRAQLRATVAVGRKDKKGVINRILRRSQSRGSSFRCANRTSGTAASSDEDIDWSWVQDVARDVTLERRAHASGDCCTGTVIVEPFRIVTTSTSSTIEPVTDMMTVDPKENSTWLRTSMRRLQHLPLPPNNELQTTNDNVNNDTLMNIETTQSLRPVSAPSRIPTNNNVPSENLQRSCSRESLQQRTVTHGTTASRRARSSSASSRSRRPRSLSSSVSSLASTVDSSPSCTSGPTPINNQTVEQQQQQNSPRSLPYNDYEYYHNNNNQNNYHNNQQLQQHEQPCDRPSRQNDMPAAESPLGQWPHSLSSMLACLGCTLGIFNISRFAILTIHFGANFIFQFFILSFLLGLPLFTLQLCLGQQLGAGVVDMWRISPLFQGVGVALLLAQALIGLYSIVGISWMFVFFRDSFITKLDKYRWAEPYLYYRKDAIMSGNTTFKLSETIPDYFNGVVLQRHHLASGTDYGTIKFQSAFNLAVVWMIVFVSLSKGLRSYGKVIYMFTLLPIFGTFVLCAKILGMMPPEYINIIFPETTWSEFFLNPKSWLAAAQESFLTWGLLGTAVMQITSHNKNKHLLQRDSSLVTVITFTILLLVAFLANTCVQILRSYGYNYVPDSFEQMSSYAFLKSTKDPLPPSLASKPIRYMGHNSFILGEKVVLPGVNHAHESGYQVLRLATELIPATFAILGPEQISPFWSVLFYFILILFGIGQQLAIWHSVITGIMAIKAKVLKSWETTITLFSCGFGFILGLPMATEFGIFVVYFMDYTVGGMWWLILVILLQIIAVFMVRGRPYSGDTVVTALFNQNSHPCLTSWAPALLSFTWNVILPVALMVVCITSFKSGNYREIFIWHHGPITNEYWPLWARQIGSMLQLIPILLIPLIAIIQSYRYLNNGPSDILEDYDDAYDYDRIQSLYRPPIGEHMTDLSIHEAVTAAAAVAHNSSTIASTMSTEDPPPKYTPPPSYTTATGARIAKFLRQSIRRSMRRLTNVLGESSRQQTVSNQTQQPPPPDYNAVLVEMNQTNTSDVSIIIPDGVSVNNNNNNNNNNNTRVSTLERLRNLHAIPGSPTLTAAEVASILRNSFRRSTVRTRRTNVGSNVENAPVSLSAENLVESAAPIGETSLVLDNLPNNTDGVKCETIHSSVI